MRSRSLLRQSHWNMLVYTVEQFRASTYSSSIKYGAELKEARSATFTVGPASTPKCRHALSRTRPRAPTKELSARIAP